ncbi:hypothetical protein ABBQ32_014049 [Trebouxia sp. C0010 RCD-2024]
MSQQKSTNQMTQWARHKVAWEAIGDSHQPIDDLTGAAVIQRGAPPWISAPPSSSWLTPDSDMLGTPSVVRLGLLGTAASDPLGCPGQHQGCWEGRRQTDLLGAAASELLYAAASELLGAAASGLLGVTASELPGGTAASELLGGAASGLLGAAASGLLEAAALGLLGAWAQLLLYRESAAADQPSDPEEELDSEAELANAEAKACSCP